MHWRVIINFLLFQTGWFATIYGAANGLPWVGVAVVVPILMWHLVTSSLWQAELKLMLALAVIGAVLDQSLLFLGLVTFPPAGWPASLLPVWMVMLWMLFATTLNVSMRWMGGRYAIAIVFGAVGGVLAYLAGEKLGAILLHDHVSLLMIALNWALAMPLAVYLAGYFSHPKGVSA
jgi:hypothetical protein